MKNKPILFIDEKPYLENEEYRRKAEGQLAELKIRLQKAGHLHLFEFYFENDENTIVKFKNLEISGLKKLLEDRSFVFVHASWPDTKDANPIMPESQIEVLKGCCSLETGLVLFSGSMHLRRRYEGTKQVNRDALYENVAFFLSQWKLNQENKPFYRILDDGEDAYYYQSREIYTEIKECLLELKKTLVSSIEGEKFITVPSPSWRKHLADENFVAICKLAKWHDEKIDRARKVVINKAYDSPNSYLSDLNKIIENEIKLKVQ